MPSSAELNRKLDAAETLLAQGWPERALVVTTPLADSRVSVNALGLHAMVLRALGRGEEALDWDRKAVACFPQSAVAWHNLAATLGDLGSCAESKAGVETALARGSNAPQTWLVYARALSALGDFEASRDAYGEVLSRNPRDAATASELAEMTWMAWGRLDEALGILDAAERRGAPGPLLALRRAGLLRANGDEEGALQALSSAVRAAPHDPSLQMAAADALLKAGRPEQALPVVRDLVARYGSNAAALTQLAFVELALGLNADALATARRGLASEPASQGLLCCAATAGRLIGDIAASALCDDETMVGSYEIARPPAWPTLAAYLADLAAALRRTHGYLRHPSDQSVHGGSQTNHLLTGSPDPALQAFFKAIEGPLREHMTSLGHGHDPLRRRNTGECRIQGAWSVLLGRGGYHRDHFHSDGWLSSAFYVETPDVALNRDTHEGWLRLGQPPFATQPALQPQRYVRPLPGKLVLFPSYMWHGTEPFTTDERRLTMAFDVLPV